MLNRRGITIALVFARGWSGFRRGIHGIILVRGGAFGCTILNLAFLIFREELGSFIRLCSKKRLKSWG